MVSGKAWNIYQAQYGSQHYQLLPERDPELTRQVHGEIGALRIWMTENDRLPISDEWTEKIPVFENDVMSRMDELPPLFIPFADDDCMQLGVPFCFEPNPELSDTKMFKELASMAANLGDRHFRVNLLLMKLVKHHSVEMDFSNLNNGFRHFNGSQSAFLAFCFEQVRLMFKGRFVCTSCATSFADKSGLKAHIKVII